MWRELTMQDLWPFICILIALLLSWKRVSNIRQIVDEYIFHEDLIDEIIIWNNNPEEHIEFGDGYDIVKVINCKNLCQW